MPPSPRSLLAGLSALASVAAHSAPHKNEAISVHNIVSRFTADVNISATPTMVTDLGWVTVTFSALSPKSTDWVAAYSPAAANITGSAPVEWFTAAAFGAAYLTTGVGSLRFQLINMREDYAFAFLRGGQKSPTLAAMSNAVDFFSRNQPRAPRLALTSDGSGMTVTWTSAVATGNPRVTLDGPGNAGVVLPASTSSYDKTDLCGAPATTVGYRSPGILNSVLMSDLSPGATYTYSIGDDSENVGPFAFTHPTASFPTRIAVYGDEGQLGGDGAAIQNDNPAARNTSRLVAQWISETTVAAVMHNGDLSYARGYAADWETFLSMNMEIFSRVAYMTDLGVSGVALCEVLGVYMCVRT